MKNKNIKTAVALKYDKSDIAPRVIAKGRGEIAEKIIQKAEKEGIKTIQNENLVKDLISLEIGQAIPEKLYMAVAEILAFVYQLDKEKGEKFEK
ncbi:EscU/YscU/HrcU family type III secretion system export apparatus switch protein [Caloranaerobacter sp. TR13]|uniref:EscU/YscU/HrcU family type III secretion system export apparatus switch protein n=1 Tax=Caloranaerobacter sp. TR13 TaxID=1302151 RepID=UPI00128D541C|nr:EscU/YscU/HrcU family type III secretion system export apparatus switch protein [Caloranaerobacter sp. TR13]